MQNGNVFAPASCGTKQHERGNDWNLISTVRLHNYAQINEIDQHENIAKLI